MTGIETTYTKDPTPKELLDGALRAAREPSGDSQWAIALGIAGILKLLIEQNDKVFGADEPDDEPVPPSPHAGQPNPVGECAAGHETWAPDCAACDEDFADITPDTQPGLEDHR